MRCSQRHHLSSTSLSCSNRSDIAGLSARKKFTVTSVGDRPAKISCRFQERSARSSYPWNSDQSRKSFEVLAKTASSFLFEVTAYSLAAASFLSVKFSNRCQPRKKKKRITLWFMVDRRNFQCFRPRCQSLISFVRPFSGETRMKSKKRKRFCVKYTRFFTQGVVIVFDTIVSKALLTMYFLVC